MRSNDDVSASMPFWYEGSTVTAHEITSCVLNDAPVTAFVLAPLILIAMGLGLVKWRRAAPMYLLALTGVVVAVVITPLSRCRVQYLGPMSAFAGLTRATGLDWSRQYPKATALVASVLGTFV
jgi:hypothetical protein